MNQITNFEKLECEKSSNINEVNVKENLMIWTK